MIVNYVPYILKILTICAILTKNLDSRHLHKLNYRYTFTNMRHNKLSVFLTICWGSKQIADGRITTPNDSAGPTIAWIDTAKIKISWYSNPCAVLVTKYSTVMWVKWWRTNTGSATTTSRITLSLIHYLRRFTGAKR